MSSEEAKEEKQVQEVKQAEKPEEKQQAAEQKAPEPEVPAADPKVVKVLDDTARLLMWASQDKSRYFTAMTELSRKRDVILSALAEALDPNVYEHAVSALAPLFGAIPSDLPKPSKPCPECERPINLDAYKKIINESSEIKDKDTAIRKAEKIAKMSYQERVNYINSVLDYVASKMRSNMVDGVMAFFLWITANQGPIAYEGMFTYPLMARPQYSEAWVRLVTASVTALRTLIS